MIYYHLLKNVKPKKELNVIGYARVSSKNELDDLDITNIQAISFYKFLTKIKEKCEFYNIRLIKAYRYYPSSKMCSCCGEIKEDLTLSMRIYKCDKCGLVINRDINAAINLARYNK